MRPYLFLGSLIFTINPTAGIAAQPAQWPILATYSATVEKAKQPKLTNNFVATDKEWQMIWRALKPNAKAPKVDFTKNFLLVSTQDAADPNRRRTTVLKDDNGVVLVRTASTLIGFRPSTMVKYTFFKVSRTGVNAVQRYDRKLRKNVQQPLPK